MKTYDTVLNDDQISKLAQNQKRLETKIDTLTQLITSRLINKEEIITQA
jgi:hypothetical protein